MVIGFSFSKTEMEKGEAIETVRDLLEPLDIKYTLDTKITNAVTHVHSRKRNTPRVLQALIDGKYVITESFADAIAHAAVPQPATDGVEVSPLEEDFDRNWPDALQFLPSATDGPGVNLSNENFAPDDRRRDVFEGYTFIFYTKKSYDALVNVITGGKGKALLREVVPGETHVNDFVRYVKSVAGEKGLGKFEDGSEGRGVVVVRYVANENEEWYVNFFNGVALQLDHRPIETRDFLSAVLALKPAQLRRPLEVEPTPRESGTSDPRLAQLLEDMYADSLQPSKIRAQPQMLLRRVLPWSLTRYWKAPRPKLRRQPLPRPDAPGDNGKGNSRASMWMMMTTMTKPKTQFFLSHDRSQESLRACS